MLFIGIGSFVLLLVVLYLIAAPALRPDPAEVAGGSALLARKERLLTDIRELDVDLATGKLDESDHRRFRAAALADTADVLQAIEEASVIPAVASANGSSDAAGAGPEDVDGSIEELVAARRRVLESSACPGCAAPFEPGDSFCRRCGVSLAHGVAR